MRKKFEILFDEAEPAPLEHPAYGPYGALGFPAPPADRPWVYSNFVQTLDGIASLKGPHPSGADISLSEEDRWLMDLLRAHADAVLYGAGTLKEEAAVMKREGGPVFSLKFPEMQELRSALGLPRLKNVFVTGSGDLDLHAFRVFNGEIVDSAIITTSAGAGRIAGRAEFPHVRVFVAGDGEEVDLRAALKELRSEWDVRYLLCEGGPTLNGNMARAGLIDERFITVSPVEAGQQIPSEQERMPYDHGELRPTTFGGPGYTKETMTWWRWLSCRRLGDHQFNRYRLVRG